MGDVVRHEAEVDLTSTGFIRLPQCRTPTSPVLSVYDDTSEPIVQVLRNGNVRIAPGADLDDVARRFWQVLADNVPEIAACRCACRSDRG